MRVAVVTTYPPRPCGIGMFSHDLRDAMVEADPMTPIEIVSIVRDSKQAAAPEVVASIRQDVRSDYAAVAADLTSRGTDVVLIEHEYGIFGGRAGYLPKATTVLVTVPALTGLALGVVALQGEAAQPAA